MIISTSHAPQTRTLTGLSYTPNALAETQLFRKAVQR